MAADDVSCRVMQNHNSRASSEPWRVGKSDQAEDRGPKGKQAEVHFIYAALKQNYCSCTQIVTTEKEKMQNHFNC